MKPEDTELITDDHFLEQWIDLLPYEKAPDNFTNGIMLQLSAGLQPVADTPESRRQMLWGYITLALAFAGVMLMIFARWPFLNFDFAISIDFLRTFFIRLMNFSRSLSEVAAYFKTGSTALIIFASIGILLLLERILRKGIHRDQTIML
ncbi:MAG: hypothetical protein PHX54_02960 [Lentimicrobiaceae bacterium]|nr:hypothetical protein [Lentimicrobiaceae bacterium]